MFKIGPVEIPNRVVAAPMAGVSDRAYRHMVQLFGCGLVFSEMVSDLGLVYGQDRTRQLTERSGDRPLALQIFGSQPESMVKGALILEELGADLIDINMGCPTPKIVKNGEGAALMLDLSRAREIIREIVRAVQVSVTVKMRRGWNDEDKTCIELAGIAEAEGASAVTLHPRSRSQFFSGHSDWELIKIVKKNLTIPVIGNGDIWKADDALKMMEETGCDAVMIGRAALGNPFIFRETVELLEDGHRISPPTIEQRIAAAYQHLELACSFKGEAIAIRQMRKHLAWYTRGLRGAARIREEINQATTRPEIHTILDKVRSEV
ncbi:MAG TPA: tRNA dihydrouridine synthase DusB [Gelria sp.]|jgi:tRNA-dihydrouridine synthase B|nr:tRNA dihydrouridine synthase DusB [Gelria sp.]